MSKLQNDLRLYFLHGVQVGAVLAQTAQGLSLRVSGRPAIVYIVNDRRRTFPILGNGRFISYFLLRLILSVSTDVFMRRKIVNGTTYYSVVENERTKDGRIKQHTVLSLGQCSTIAAALVAARNEFEYFQREAEILEAHYRAGEAVGYRGCGPAERRKARERVAKCKRQIEILKAAQRDL